LGWTNGAKGVLIALLREGETMKIKTLIVLAAIVCDWHAGAQTDQAPSPYWVVNGQIYNINNSQLWKKMDGDIVKILTNGIVVETFTVETKQQAVVVRRLKANSYMTTDESKKYHDVTEMVDVGTEKVPGRKIIIRNYPLEESPAVGKTIAFFAMQTGTSDYNGDKLELWDLGTTPTADDLKKLKADTEERQRAAQKELDEQRRVAAEKANAAKKAAQDKALKYNQDQAAKGDPIGLQRMGERYRDGNGVPKDLDKARDYFTQAQKAGNFLVDDELKKLNQTSTNSPATQ
jgi:hypothetical protein